MCAQEQATLAGEQPSKNGIESSCEWLYDVFEAFPGFSGEIRVQADGTRVVIAATPFRLHSLNV
jgi:hypothetical protein